MARGLSTALNGHLQFSSRDEYRYHEPLVLPALSVAHLGGPDAKLRVLVLGGGDGMAVRQLLATNAVGHIDLVDIDPRVVEIFRDTNALRQLNHKALSDRRVHAHFEDAMIYLRNYVGDQYHVIIMDLPDPSSVATNKLYTSAFFGLALRHLHARGAMVTQASSPFYARTTYWCIANTVEAAVNKSQGVARSLVPYHAYVPSFGEWGFVMVVPAESAASSTPLRFTGRFLNQQTYEQALNFPPDCGKLQTDINRLDSPVLVKYHARDWAQWGE